MFLQIFLRLNPTLFTYLRHTMAALHIFSEPLTGKFCMTAGSLRQLCIHPNLVYPNSSVSFRSSDCQLSGLLRILRTLNETYLKKWRRLLSESVRNVLIKLIKKARINEV